MLTDFRKKNAESFSVPLLLGPYYWRSTANDPNDSDAMTNDVGSVMADDDLRCIVMTHSN